VRQRIVAYVTRKRDGRKELLAFEDEVNQPGVLQVPAGRLDPGESLEEGLRRELYEEAGIERYRIVREVHLPADARYPGSRSEDHAFELELEEVSPDEWEHAVLGDGDDAGFVFRYRWQALDSRLRLWRTGVDPALEQLVEGHEDLASGR
jgi:8-oxo-dGTP pyrophosphatase MutT (NUDIX family)